ncbi:hypothetical protein [Pelagibacterium limicola]|uniref:hypothetical protein n=1 Tax=Pelagibacterium limicola TaxID=2791022 RepID=UPI0018B0104C|nr:hypothetical protein [Pelagibacterium limicola]
MANRVLLGERGGEFGLWVSKPGQNVLTAGVNGLLLSPEIPMLQVIYAERRSVTVRASPNNNTVFSWPDPGYFAFAWLSGPAEPYYLWNNRSQITVTYNPNVSSPALFDLIVFNVPRHP